VRRRRKVKGAGLAAIAALAIVAITAGGGSKTAPTASTPSTTAVTTPASTAPAPGSGLALTPAEYRKRANAICEPLSRLTSSQATSLQQTAPVVAKTVAEASSALARLRALRPRKELVSQVDDALGIMQQGVEVGAQLVSAAQGNDQAGARSAYEQLEGLATAEHGIWKQIRVPQC
jgi:hypothetical protein